jgi:hypothetical protein
LGVDGRTDAIDPKRTSAMFAVNLTTRVLELDDLRPT